MTVCTNVTTQLEITPVTVMISLRLTNQTAKAASVSNLSFFCVCEHYTGMKNIDNLLENTAQAPLLWR